MITIDSRPIALIPIRHHSERVPGKNYREFAGEPLYRHIVRVLIACPEVDGVVIDTDSALVRDDARREFPRVRIIERPEHLSGDLVPMNDVLLHDISVVESPLYLQTHATNPLLTCNTIMKAIRMFRESYPVYDSLFSVTRLQRRFWTARTQPINHDPGILLRTQDLAPVFEENSCLYLFPRAVLDNRHNRIGDRPLMFEVDPVEAWDIDEEIDFRIAEFLYMQRTATR